MTSKLSKQDKAMFEEIIQKINWHDHQLHGLSQEVGGLAMNVSAILNVLREMKKISPLPETEPGFD